MGTGVILATRPVLTRETETLVEVRLLRPQQDQQDRPEVVVLTGIRVPGRERVRARPYGPACRACLLTFHVTVVSAVST
jgi:hypothetical protein